MKVNVGITHNCELLAQEIPQEQIDYFKYLRLEAELNEILEPCNESSFDISSIKDTMDSVLDPCHEDRDKIVYLEFLVSKHLNTRTTVKISEDQFEEYRFTLPKDGLYVYYKLMVYKKSSLDAEYKNKLYFNEKDEEFYLNDKKIINFEDLLLYLDQTGFVVDYYEQPVFSLCKLEHCVFNLQRTALLPIMKFCGKNTCEESKNDKNQRNFLFISLEVLKHLISEEKYDEAEEILEALSSCGSLCKDISNNHSNCGCG